MARLPVPGSDGGDWGDILNAFLAIAHNSDGSLASNTVGNTQLDAPTQAAIATVASKYTKPGSGIPATDLASSVQTSLTAAGNAISTSQLGVASGIAQLDGNGTLTVSQIPNTVQNSSQLVVMVAAANGTNDSTQIQTAINQASTLATTYAGTATVKLQPGQSYYIQTSTTSWTFAGNSVTTAHGLLMAQGVTLDLNGSTMTWAQYSGTIRYMIGVPDGINNWSITGNGCFNGNYSPSTTETNDFCIQIGECSDWDSTNTNFTNFGGKFVLVQAKTTNLAQRFRISNNRMTAGCSNAIGVNNAQYWEVTDNYVHDAANGSTGTEWLIGNTLSNGIIARNQSVNWGNTNLSYNNTTLTDIQIVDNYIQAPVGSVQANIGIFSSIAQNIIIRNNILDLTNSSATTIANIVIQGVNPGLVIDGNLLLSSGSTTQPAIRSISTAGATTPLGWVISNNIQQSTTGTTAALFTNIGSSSSGIAFIGNQIQNIMNIGTNSTAMGNTGTGSITAQTGCTISGNTLTSTSNPIVRLNGNQNTVTGNSVTTTNTGSLAPIMVYSGGSNNIVSNNTIVNSGSNRAIYEQAVGCVGNLYTGNQITTTATPAIVGSSGTLASVGGIVRGNVGTNPVGTQTVTVPASASATTASPVDLTFYVTNGSASSNFKILSGPTITVPASAITSIRVPAGQTLTPTYTVAPTWVVEGE